MWALILLFLCFLTLPYGGLFSFVTKQYVILFLVGVLPALIMETSLQSRLSRCVCLAWDRKGLECAFTVSLISEPLYMWFLECSLISSLLGSYSSLRSQFRCDFPGTLFLISHSLYSLTIPYTSFIVESITLLYSHALTSLSLPVSCITGLNSERSRSGCLIHH